MLVTHQSPVALEAPAALGESAHDKAMIAKMDGPAPAAVEPVKPAAATAPATPATRPENIPEKFWDAAKGEVRVDEMARSFTELEKLRSKPAEAAKPAEAPETPDAAAQAAAEAAKAAGADTSKVDIAAISAEFAEKGVLSSEAYAKLEAAGLSTSMVDQYIAGQTAILNAQVSEAHGLAGGADQYGVMLDWATQNLPADEQAAFDRAVVADPATRKQAITALKAQYTAAVGNTPDLINGRQGASSVGSYASRAEVTADMRNPKYRSDPAFRALVEGKLANSTVF